MFKKAFIILIAGILLVSLVPLAAAAPSGTLYPPVGAVADNVLLLGGTEWVVITFNNAAGATITDVASTIQYIRLAAANLNPSRTIIDLSENASWEIFAPPYSSPRASGTVNASLNTNAIYSPYSTSSTVYLYNWSLGKPGGPSNLDNYTSSAQFDDSLKILRPGEILKLNVTMRCQNMVGDTRVWFFFQATEDAFASGSYPTSISQIADKSNLYYSKLPGPDQTIYWLPLHNSYDPYDSDIGTGHNFDQHSWTRGETTAAFAKSNKLVHQKPVENPALPCIHVVKDANVTMAEVGDAVKYNITVTNCGNVPLTKVNVTDDVLGTIDTSGFNLAVGESRSFYVEHQITAQDSDPLVDNATAAGLYDATNVTDWDVHSVDIVTALRLCIHVVKDANVTMAEVGDTVKYNITVVNCGTADLSKVNVTDDVLGVIITNIDLAAGESQSFYVEHQITAQDSDPLVDNATAAGLYDATNVTDWDVHSVDIIVEPTFSFHICGIKFDDLNRNGIYDVETELGINGVNVSLLGPDQETKATDAYLGMFTYPPPENTPPLDVLQTGENMLAGSYCYNLINIMPGTYIFYIRIEEPSGKGSTTPTLIGPITLVTSPDGPRESLNNNFGNALPRPVGGYLTSVSKLAVLSPYLALVGLIGAASAVFVNKRRRKA